MCVIRRLGHRSPTTSIVFSANGTTAIIWCFEVFESLYNVGPTCTGEASGFDQNANRGRDIEYVFFEGKDIR